MRKKMPQIETIWISRSYPKEIQVACIERAQNIQQNGKRERQKKEQKKRSARINEHLLVL